MKFFMNCFTVFFVVGFSLSGFAESLFDEHGNLLPIHMIRCRDNLESTPEECSSARELALLTGCLDPSEYDHANELGLLILCHPIKKRMVAMACPCACFHKGTHILVSDTDDNSPWVKVEELTSESSIVSFTDESTVDLLTKKMRNVVYTTSGPEEEGLYVVHTSNNSPLSVTQHHALLLSTGKMIAAKDLKIGDKLVGEFGQILEVKDITREYTSDEVFNLLLKSESHAGHLLVAEGIVSGDLIWQNMLNEEFNNVSLR